MSYCNLKFIFNVVCFLLSECGGTLRSVNGSFTSPGYPGNTTLSSECTWRIDPPSRRLVTLWFTDLDVEGSEDQIGICAANSVKIYQATNTLPTGTYCGSVSTVYCP